MNKTKVQAKKLYRHIQEIITKVKDGQPIDYYDEGDLLNFVTGVGVHYKENDLVIDFIKECLPNVYKRYQHSQKKFIEWARKQNGYEEVWDSIDVDVDDREYLFPNK